MRFNFLSASKRKLSASTLHILGFILPLEFVLGFFQHEDQRCASESQGSHYEAEK